MGLKSIPIGKKEEQLLKDVTAAKEKFEEEIKTIAKKYGKDKLVEASADYPEEDQSRDRQTKMKEDTVSVLSKIFNPSFAYTVLYDLDVQPDIVLELDKLVPFVCNFPAKYTVRTKNYHRNGSAPCKRRLGRDSVYFCALPRHMAYAKKVNLPITLDDLKKRNLPIPIRPKIPPKNRHIHTVENVQGKRKKDKEDQAKWVEDVYINNRKKLKVDGKSKPSAIVQSEDIEYASEEENDEEAMEMEEDEEELGLHLCMFAAEDGEMCTEVGIHPDPADNYVTYCDRHVKVSLQQLYHSEDDVLRADLAQIRDLDAKIEGYLKRGEDDDHLRTLVTERYLLARKCGFGIPKTYVPYVNI